MKKFGSLLIVLLLVCMVVSVFATAQAQSKPTVPEFTIRFVDNSYDVPPTQTQCHFHKTSLCVKNPILPSMGDRNG